MVAEWKNTRLVDLMRIETGSRNTEDRIDGGKYPFFVRSQQVEHIDDYNYDCEAVLTAGDGVGTGKVFHYINGKFDAHQRVYVMSQFDGIDGKYFFYFFSVNFLAEVEKYTAKSSVDSVRRNMIAEMEVPLPPLPEQRVIAVALSDTDAYIAALEKLIAKKRAVKQGAMQELLTGKRRLPGFRGEWVNLNLAANSTLKARIGWQGLTTAEYLDEGYAFLITGTDFNNGRIAWDSCHYVEKHRYDQDPNIQVDNRDVLITKDGTIGKVAIVKGLSKKATLNSGVFVIRPKGNAYNSVYVYYVLLSEIFTDFLAKLAAGSTINHLYQKDLVSFEFKIPPTADEQTAIAEVLSDMDVGIDALTAKLNKAKQIKQGMMSELLTGRIRLVEAEPAKVTVEAYPEAEAEPIRQVAEQTTTKKHTQQFDDAVMIAGIVSIWAADNTYPLGRKKTQKLLYLLRRHQSASTEQFHKKAAGPYADTIRYRGGEPIAISRKYIVEKKSEAGSSFSTGSGIKEAFSYLSDWGARNDFAWLKSHFHFTCVDDLELLTTIDMAICDLNHDNIPVTVDSIKCLIATSKEWKAKLKREIFSDANIARAIHWSNQLFGTEV